ncbi:bifunctional acetate--CoA ligase family protein/GNAT family N-acetyltransferase [Neptuniibacter sp. 2_MG-2023]|uniref:bifunctional acetate--CoA ligase family protein/GNAT family N-acetyltransferase n=1 Tax=Neptuniibacter sp. 2_MG-2023 TaxID=3062671 RepID=UPI0026E35919|nr:bifunctional acetate--CoA ligase family protein/GNAT family N-acetyltransferase [Neptuniibacter sp. 2_MG-2023]MDO6513111.1 bifunctional acetate--CoA ligase family protein/GNAT family N-acetyltransferase [Neptuniibacter sp. 2_MG-2023]
MATKYLKRFFKPASIAVFGASAREDSMGGIVIQNLLESGFKGSIYAVNRHEYDEVHGVPCFKTLSDLPEMPDLAIVCSPPETVADLIRGLGVSMVKAAMILTGGLSMMKDETHRSLRDEVREVAKPYGIRIMGPDCMGMLVPGHNMNASYSHVNILKGKVAYIGQSGILGTAMIDWATGQEIGFSHFLTLGDGADVDLPSVIDYLAQDPYTHAILLQLNRVDGSARDFISAVRSASRNKLVLVLKNDTFIGAKSATKLAEGIYDDDLVYDAALRRAGVVRVKRSDELFNALETLTRMKPMRGERLAILCNGTGPNALATEQLFKHRGKLAELTDETLDALAEILPTHWNRSNPVDLNSDARPERFAEAVRLLTKDKNVDAVLMLHAPTRMASSVETADAVIQIAKKTPRNILTCFMGRATAIEARNHCNSAGISTFLTPEESVDAFMHMVDFHRNQEVMRQTPPPYMEQSSPHHIRARQLVQDALTEERDYLRHEEAIELLDLYDIPVANTFYCDSIDDVVKCAQKIEGSVQVKALHKQNVYPFSYDETGRQRWKEIVQDLFSSAEVEHATTQLSYRMGEVYPAEHLMGFCVQQMKRGFQSLQINVGITRDPTFGPVIFFGVGGHTVDVLADRHVMLPPLNLALASELISQSRLCQIIEENSYRPELDLQQLANLLLKLSEMIVDLPNLKGLEINPMLVNKSGLLVMDVAVSLSAKAGCLSISPYPEHLTEKISLKRSGRKAIIRAIRGEDEPNHLEFYNKLSPQSIRLRYFYSRGIPTHQELANWTQIDYDREMAFIITAPREDGEGMETLGVVRAVTDADNVQAEFSVVIRDDLQGEGLGVALMNKVIEYCKSRGTLQITGSTLPNNKGMQNLAKKLGFTNSYNAEEEVVDMKMMLNDPLEDWQRLRLNLPR